MRRKEPEQQAGNRKKFTENVTHLLKLLTHLLKLCHILLKKKIFCEFKEPPTMSHR